GGLTDLVDALLAAMPGVRFVTGEVAKIKEGFVRIGEDFLETDHIILAIPAPAARKLWPDAPEVKYVTTSTVSLCYPKFGDFKGTGFVIPRGEKRKILACTWTSNKFEGRAPEHRFLARCFVKGDV